LAINDDGEPVPIGLDKVCKRPRAESPIPWIPGALDRVPFSLQGNERARDEIRWKSGYLAKVFVEMLLPIRTAADAIADIRLPGDNAIPSSANPPMLPHPGKSPHSPDIVAAAIPDELCEERLVMDKRQIFAASRCPLLGQ
jgi:hypothetical protein